MNNERIKLLKYIFCLSDPFISPSLSDIMMLVSCSFYTFSRLPEVKEIVVVCDPSYQDIFEGVKPFICLSSDGQACMHIPFAFNSIVKFVLVASQLSD